VKAEFKKGELVKILNVNIEGNLGIIIKRGINPAEGEQYMISRDEWLVHLVSGKEVWLWTNEVGKLS
jgi:hypothetical protein